MAMIVERSMSDGFLSNTYLVAAGPDTDAFLVDAGGPLGPLFEKADAQGLNVTHILLTHHHHDHVCDLDEARKHWPEAKVMANPAEEIADTEPLNPGDTVKVGRLTVTAIHTPGHTGGMLNLLVNGQLFTGDTLFKGSVGGVRAPGSTSFEDIKHSIMEVILKLPGDTVLRPGHTDPSTVGDELQHNPFVRIWRGEDPEGDEQCTALGNPATLVLWGPDYDGGHKAWVRWPDGSDDIVPGSKVER